MQNLPIPKGNVDDLRTTRTKFTKNNWTERSCEEISKKMAEYNFFW